MSTLTFNQGVHGAQDMANAFPKVVPLGLMFFTRIWLAEGARATVVLHIRGETQGKLLLNAGTDLRISEAAALELILVQDLNQESYYFQHENARVERDGSLRHIEVSLGGALVKTRMDCSLEGQGSEARLNGLYFARGAQDRRLLEQQELDPQRRRPGRLDSQLEDRDQ